MTIDKFEREEKCTKRTLNEHVYNSICKHQHTFNMKHIVSCKRKNSLRDNFPDGFTMEGKTMAEVNNRSPNVQSFRQPLNPNTMWMKTLMISILNNSEKLV